MFHITFSGIEPEVTYLDLFLIFSYYKPFCVFKFSCTLLPQSVSPWSYLSKRNIVITLTHHTPGTKSNVVNGSSGILLVSAKPLFPHLRCENPTSQLNKTLIYIAVHGIWPASTLQLQFVDSKKRPEASILAPFVHGWRKKENMGATDIIPKRLDFRSLILTHLCIYNNVCTHLYTRWHFLVCCIQYLSFCLSPFQYMY